MEIIQNNIDFLILTLLSTIGITIVIYNVFLIFKGRQTVGWTEVRGQITKSEISISQNLTKEIFENHYRADIEYEYEFAGVKYYSKRGFLGDEVYIPYKDKAEKTVKMFPMNQIVTVFVNPNNNSESVLIKGSGTNRIPNIIIGLILVVIGVLIKSNYELILNILKGLEK